MKYKKGDLVKVKSRKWWNKQAKDKNGDIVKGCDLNIGILSFGADKSYNCCGKIGEITKIDLRDNSYILKFNLFDKIYWFHEDWIEDVSIINIHLKLMKNEI